MDQARHRILEMKSEIIQAAAHPIRLAIIEYLEGGEQCVCDIVSHVEAQRSNVSRHLALMLKAGVLACRKDGLKVFYQLKTPCILKFLSCVDQALRERIQGEVDLLKAVN
jgi:DNA-binding transcriptional ArsR family regulator